MLYDKRWEKKVAGDEGVSPEIFSLDGLIAWLEAQNPATNYVWSSSKGECLISLYLFGVGKHGLIDFVEFNKNTDADYLIAYDEPHTFGAALSRARKIAEAR